MDFYVLDGKRPVKATQAESARLLHDFEARTVARTWVGQAEVSTVFLCFDHGDGEGEPLLFETAVFRKGVAGEMERYATWEAAEAGHAQMVARVPAAPEPPALLKGA